MRDSGSEQKLGDLRGSGGLRPRPNQCIQNPVLQEPTPAQGELDFQDKPSSPSEQSIKKKVKSFRERFIAVDNKVNEQTVMGLLFTSVFIVLVTLHVAGVGKAGLDLIITVGSMTLGCFGIAGLKR